MEIISAESPSTRRQPLPTRPPRLAELRVAINQWVTGDGIIFPARIGDCNLRRDPFNHPARNLRRDPFESSFRSRTRWKDRTALTRRNCYEITTCSALARRNFWVRLRDGYGVLQGHSTEGVAAHFLKVKK